jgi:hypothetical protein
MVADELVLVLEDIQSLTGKKISFDIFMDIDADEPRSSTAEVISHRTTICHSALTLKNSQDSINEDLGTCGT